MATGNLNVKNLNELLDAYHKDAAAENLDESGQHQQTSLENLLDEIVAESNNVHNRIEAIEKQITPPQNAEVSTLDMIVGYLPLVFALIICALLGRLVYLGAKHNERLTKDEDKIKALEDNRQLRNEVELLKNQIVALNDRFEKQSKLLTEQKKNIESNSLPTKNFSSNHSTSTASKSPTPEPLAWKDFVDEYNSLKSLQGRDLRSGIDNFIKKYNVKGFDCENAQERLNNPDAEPKFVERQPNRCDYWHYMSKDGKNVVVPSASVTSYNDNFHNERAMSLFFDSNFVGSKTYSEILVQRPTILNSSWNVEQKGLLRLNY